MESLNDLEYIQKNLINPSLCLMVITLQVIDYNTFTFVYRFCTVVKLVPFLRCIHKLTYRALPPGDILTFCYFISIVWFYYKDLISLSYLNYPYLDEDTSERIRLHFTSSPWKPLCSIDILVDSLILSQIKFQIRDRKKWNIKKLWSSKRWIVLNEANNK